MTSRPHPGEYAPYYEKYVGLVPDGDVVVDAEFHTRKHAFDLRRCYG